MSDELANLSQTQGALHDAERTLGRAKNDEEREKRERRESAQKEYSEVASFIRHYSGLRFAVLTLFFAVSGVTGGAVFGNTLAHRNAEFILTLECLAVLFTAVFGAFAWRLDIFLVNLNLRGEELRKFLDYRHGIRRRVPALISFLDMRLIYLAVAVFWLAMIVTDSFLRTWWQITFHPIVR